MELIETQVNDLSVKQDRAKGAVSLHFQLTGRDQGSGISPEQQSPGNGRDTGAGLDNGSAPCAYQEMASTPGIAMRELGNGQSSRRFPRLGLDCGTIDQFIPFIVSYVRRKGGDAINNFSSQDLGREVGQTLFDAAVDNQERLRQEQGR